MKRIFSVVIFCWCALCPSLFADTVPSRDEMTRMVFDERFDELEKLMTGFRSQKTEFYKGQIPLRMAYDNLSGLSRNLGDDEWQTYVEKLEKWKAAYPESPTPLVVLGNIYTSWAWKARGSGYADSVTEEGWRLMKERLTLGRDCLEKADRLSVRDPEIYRGLLQVALGQGWSKEEMDVVFKKGVALDPNYLRLYEAKAYFLLPRWYGDRGEWEAFAKEAADARGGEEGDILYMHIARSQAWSEGGEFFRNTDISYDRVKRGFEASLKRDPNDTYEENSFCYYACIAGDRPTAKELFGKMGGQWQQDIWGNHAYFDQWQRWANGSGATPSTGHPERRRLHMNWGRLGLVFVAVWIGLLLLIGGIIWLMSRRSGKAVSR